MGRGVAKTPLLVSGRGNLGRSLARALNASGNRARLVPAREVVPRIASDTVVFLAVPDSAVEDVAKRIARSSASERVSFVHVSGALGLDALAPLGAEHAVGSFHPLQSFPDPRPPDAFAGVTIAVDASTPALRRTLARLARDLGGRPKHVGDGARGLYHAAAVFASNYVVVVVDEGVRLLQRAGFSRTEAEKALVPLVEGVVSNIRRQGSIKALTGPVRRGDVETVQRHLAALGNAPQIEAVYRMLGQVALEIAKEAGLEPAAAERTKRALTRKVAATQRRRRS
ncbi:MAG: DUF2520 domain-containing protein [Chloroflexi bacterium]|nr:MAG: DUF2520 domain-containing protein [Chloroflexota bacterium]